MKQAQHESVAAPGARRPLSVAGQRVLAVLALLLIVLFAGLGTWQVQRLNWKLDLIARVDSRVHAPPVAPPPAARWAQVSASSDEYRHVVLAGTFLYEYTTPVQAVTELGSGYWLLTPLCTPDGAIVLVNRGFIPAALGAQTAYVPRKAAGAPCANADAGRQVAVTGLLRIGEPGGAFLRTNDPVANRWYSRDVAALAAARGLPNVAPYFVDAAAGQDQAGAPDRPTGGLTVISFHNSHLIYAFTWYALALMVASAWWWIARGGGSRERDDDSTA
jgi:surfeit locus 1 family protein